MENKRNETDIVKGILEYLNYSGIFSFRVNTVGVWDDSKKTYRRPGKFTLKGTSDILGVLKDGRMLAIEVKTDKGKLTDDQKAFLYRVNKQGGLAFVARSIDEVKLKLGTINESKIRS